MISLLLLPILMFLQLMFFKVYFLSFPGPETWGFENIADDDVVTINDTFVPDLGLLMDSRGWTSWSFNWASLQIHHVEVRQLITFKHPFWSSVQGLSEKIAVPRYQDAQADLIVKKYLQGGQDHLWGCIVNEFYFLNSSRIFFCQKLV